MKKERRKKSRDVEADISKPLRSDLPKWPESTCTNLVLLALLGLFLFRTIFLHLGELMWANDIIRFTLAGRFAEWRSLWEDKSTPYWDPTIFCGMSTTGDQARGITNPLTWIHWLLPFPQLFGPFSCFATIFGAWGMFLFVRERGTNAFGAFFAAAAFGMSGKVAGHLFAGHLFLVTTALSLPWMLWGAERVITRRDNWSAVVFGFALTMGALQGAVQIFYWNILFVAAYCTIRLMDQKEEGFIVARNRVAGLIKGCALGGLLSAPWWFPVIRQTLLLGARTQDIGYDFSTMASARPQDLLRHLWPFAGTPQPELFAHDAKMGFFWESASYPGVVTIALAVTCLVIFYRERTLLWISGLGLLALLISLGPSTPLHKAAYHLLPGFSLFRAPARLFFYSNFVFALLAGTAIGKESTSKTTWWTAGALLGILQLVLLVTLGINNTLLAPEKGLWLPLLVLAVLAVTSLLLAYRQVSTEAWRYTCLGVLVVELVLLWPSHLYTASTEQVFPKNPAAEYLATQKFTRPFRILDTTGTIPQQVAALHGLEIVTGYHPGVYGHQLELYKRIWHEDHSSIVELQLHQASKIAAPQILDLMNVEYIVTYENLDSDAVEKVHEAHANPSSPLLQIYRRKSSLPRAFLVAEARMPDTGATVLDMVAKSDPRTQAFVDEEALEGEAGFQELKAEMNGAGEINLEFTCDKPGVVVVSESWHPDWRVLDNGIPVNVHRVNHAQLGVSVSSGTHKLQFRYVPWDLYVGIALAGSALIVIFIAGLIRVFRGPESQTAT